MYKIKTLRNWPRLNTYKSLLSFYYFTINFPKISGRFISDYIYILFFETDSSLKQVVIIRGVKSIIDLTETSDKFLTERQVPC